MKNILPLLALSFATATALAATKPNILVILADDAGYADSIRIRRQNSGRAAQRP